MERQQTEDDNSGIGRIVEANRFCFGESVKIVDESGAVLHEPTTPLTDVEVAPDPTTLAA